ncbi:DUF5641 domain-containing protein [Trichonephila clavipes]|nr:DUF5641 domain-containing protein [Trichonephila clavipes]
MQDIRECNLTDLDAVQKLYFCKRLKYRQAVRKDLRKRFRSDYLGVLIQQRNKKSRNFTVSVGEIVMMGADIKKENIIWPLVRITEIIPGKDGQVQLVSVNFSTGISAPDSRDTYPLEISSDNLSVPMIPDDLKKPNDISKTLDCVAVTR